MTPTESREAALALSRERLARATVRIERVARDAAEHIYHLKEEKRALEKRLVDLEMLFAQERQSFDQRASLLSSVNAESEERAKAFADLAARVNEQEQLVNEQIERIALLEADLENRAAMIRNQSALETAWKTELGEWKTKVVHLEERVETVCQERDALRAKIYEDERLNAQFVLHLTPDERDNAAKAIDSLIDQISGIESRAHVTNEK